MFNLTELTHLHRCVNMQFKAVSRSARNPAISSELAAGFRAEAHTLREIVNALETLIEDAGK